MKRTIIEFLIGLPVVAGVYALLEYLYCTLLTHEPFVFDIKVFALCVVVWAVVEVVAYVIRKKKEK